MFLHMSSLQVEHKKMPSGYSRARLFFISRMSKELPSRVRAYTSRFVRVVLAQGPC